MSRSCRFLLFFTHMYQVTLKDIAGLLHVFDLYNTGFDFSMADLFKVKVSVSHIPHYLITISRAMTLLWSGQKLVGPFKIFYTKFLIMIFN